MSCDLLKLATSGVTSLQPYQPGKPVEELERELGIKNIIKLASNENPLGASPKALAVLKKPGDLSRYPDGNGFRLKTALADYHSVHADQITLGNGSNEILELIARAILIPEHEVIFSEHAFAVYPLVTQAIGARAVVVPAKEWGHDVDGMLTAITQNSRLMFIANPNNPTGTWLKKAELRCLLESVPEDLIVVVDEAYFDYVQEPDYPNCIGYGVAHRELADLLNRVRQPFNINSLALACAEAALDDRAHVQKTVSNNQAGMRYLTDAFKQMALDYIPSAGNFVCIDFRRPARDIYNRLLHEGVIVRPIDNYGMPNHLRVTIGREEENKRFIEALEKMIEKK